MTEPAIRRLRKGPVMLSFRASLCIQVGTLQHLGVVVIAFLVADVGKVSLILATAPADIFADCYECLVSAATIKQPFANMQNESVHIKTINGISINELELPCF